MRTKTLTERRRNRKKMKLMLFVNFWGNPKYDVLPPFGVVVAISKDGSHDRDGG
jgi:hypothetical protein